MYVSCSVDSGLTWLVFSKDYWDHLHKADCKCVWNTMKPYIWLFIFSVARLRANSQTLKVYFCLTEVSGCFVIDSQRGKAESHTMQLSFCVASFSQNWWRDDVDEIRVGGLKAPIKTLVLVLGQKWLWLRFLMRNPYMRPSARARF